MALIRWHKASDLALADDAPVATWGDASGSSVDLAQATAGKRPVFKTSPARVRFDGTDDYLKWGSAVSPTDCTIFVVFSPTNPIATSDSQALFGRESGTNPYGTVYLGNASTPKFANEIIAFINYETGGSVVHGVASTAALSGLNIFAFRISGAQNKIYKNGSSQVLLTSSDGTMDSGTAFRFSNVDIVGSSQDANSPFAGDIYEIRIYDTALSASEVRNIHEALASTYGITSTFSRVDGTKTAIADGSDDSWVGALDYIDDKDEHDWTLTVGDAGEALSLGVGLTIPGDRRLTIQSASSSNRPTLSITYTGAFAFQCSHTDSNTIRFKDFIFDSWDVIIAIFFLGGSGEDCFAFTNLKFLPSGGPPHAFRICSPNASPTGSAPRGPYGVFSGIEVVGTQSWQMVHGRDNDQLSSWRNPHSWATKDKVVFENIITNFDTFINGFTFIDGDQGFRFHLRHATLKNTPIGLHGSEGDNSKLDAGFEMQISDVVHTVGNGQTVAQLLFCRSGAFRGWNITCIKEGTGIYSDGAFFKTFYYRDTDTDFEGNPTLADRTYIDGSGTGGDDYVGTQMPGCGHVGTPGQDPNYLSEPWGSVPMRLWNITYGSGVDFLYDYSLGTGFNQIDRDLFFSFNGTAAPAGWEGELPFPHPLLTADATPPQLVSATINAAGDTLALVFDEAVTGVVANDYHLAGHILSSPTGSGTTWSFTVGPKVAQGEAVTLSYGSETKDAAGNVMPPFTGFRVRNKSTRKPRKPKR